MPFKTFSYIFATSNPNIIYTVLLFNSTQRFKQLVVESADDIVVEIKMLINNHNLVIV